ncbi:hypothetical protein J5N97_026801 [Dioscorea zingiberensis]|uniref:Uncharacterized protein n=1 Tax=Dioscorea zingiberensis TaxID=325984 RepID=A0A9D5C3N9_9LILI|nr:hypothetical protein J5N97_026801 [Dioscorea zingiberensis]
MGRAPCCDKANVKKGPWSPEEDAKLKAYIEEHGTGGNWIALPHKIGELALIPSPSFLFLLFDQWSIIAAQLPGRTDNDIKNYWNTRLKKKLLGKRPETSPSSHLSNIDSPNDQEINGMHCNSPSPPALSASAIERMQLHMQLQGLYNNPFSFYNHPALWPKHHPLMDRVPHSQQTDAVITTPVNQDADDYRSSQLQGINNLPMGATMQEDQFERTTIGFSSSSSTTASDSEVAGLQAELRELIYGRNESFVRQEDHQITNLDCFKDMNEGKEHMNWWPSNAMEEKYSSPSSWDSVSGFQPDSLIQEFMLGYDI